MANIANYLTAGGGSGGKYLSTCFTKVYLLHKSSEKKKVRANYNHEIIFGRGLSRRSGKNQKNTYYNHNCYYCIWLLNTMYLNLGNSENLDSRFISLYG